MPLHLDSRLAPSIGTITFDSHDPRALARFWADLLGYVPESAGPAWDLTDGGTGDEPADVDDDEAGIVDPNGLGPDLLFLAVPDDKVVKNRVHLDLLPSRHRDEEVERVLALGATLVDDLRRPDGAGWVVFADPEGNEFCVVRSAAERDWPTPVDTGLRRMPPIRTADERATLEGLLEWYRAGIVAKVAGVHDLVARATPLRSSTSIAGLVKHLALVEDAWFAKRFAGLGFADWCADVDWDADPDWEFHTAGEEGLALQVARYEAACERSRVVAAGHDLDALARSDEGRPFTLRFAYTHMLEETARHLGHLDVLRELLDGTTGE